MNHGPQRKYLVNEHPKHCNAGEGHLLPVCRQPGRHASSTAAVPGCETAPMDPRCWSCRRRSIGPAAGEQSARRGPACDHASLPVTVVAVLGGGLCVRSAARPVGVNSPHLGVW